MGKKDKPKRLGWDDNDDVEAERIAKAAEEGADNVQKKLGWDREDLATYNYRQRRKGCEASHYCNGTRIVGHCMYDDRRHTGTHLCGTCLSQW